MEIGDYYPETGMANYFSSEGLQHTTPATYVTAPAHLFKSCHSDISIYSVIATAYDYRLFIYMGIPMITPDICRMDKHADQGLQYTWLKQSHKYIGDMSPMPM